MKNIDMIFLFVLAAFIGYYMCKKESFEGFAAIDDARQAVREVYNADIDAIRNLSTVATKLQAGGLTIPGTLKVTSGQTIEGLGRLHMFGPELLYILNKNGVIIGKEWGGNGNLSVQGNLHVNETANVSGDINAHNINVASGHTIAGKGRLHMFGPELLYILNKSGVIIGKEWGGNGNLSVQGDMTVQNRNVISELNTLNSKFANMTASQVFNINRGDNGWNGRTSGNFTVGSGKKIFQINLSLFVNGNNGVDINFYFSNGFRIWCGSYINHGGNHTGQSFTRVIENWELPAGTHNVRVTCNLHVDGNDYLHASMITLPI